LVVGHWGGIKWRCRDEVVVVIAVVLLVESLVQVQVRDSNSRVVEQVRNQGLNLAHSSQDLSRVLVARNPPPHRQVPTQKGRSRHGSGQILMRKEAGRRQGRRRGGKRRIEGEGKRSGRGERKRNKN